MGLGIFRRAIFDRGQRDSGYWWTCRRAVGTNADLRLDRNFQLSTMNRRGRTVSKSDGGVAVKRVGKRGGRMTGRGETAEQGAVGEVEDETASWPSLVGGEEEAEEN